MKAHIGYTSINITKLKLWGVPRSTTDRLEFVVEADSDFKISLTKFETPACTINKRLAQHRKLSAVCQPVRRFSRTESTLAQTTAREQCTRSITFWLFVRYMHCLIRRNKTHTIRSFGGLAYNITVPGEHQNPCLRVRSQCRCCAGASRMLSVVVATRRHAEAPRVLGADRCPCRRRHL